LLKPPQVNWQPWLIALLSFLVILQTAAWVRRKAPRP
jgi:hypothetical protein